MSYKGSITQLSILNTAKNVDLTVAAETNLLQFPSTNGGIIFDILVEIVSISGFVSVATASIGGNASSYNDWLVASALTGLSSAGLALSMKEILGATPFKSYAPNSLVKWKNTVGAVATSMQANIYVFGSII